MSKKLKKFHLNPQHLLPRCCCNNVFCCRRAFRTRSDKLSQSDAVSCGILNSLIILRKRILSDSRLFKERIINQPVDRPVRYLQFQLGTSFLFRLFYHQPHTLLLVHHDALRIVAMIPDAN